VPTGTLEEVLELDEEEERARVDEEDDISN
jgi:hypothetical protein